MEDVLFLEIAWPPAFSTHIPNHLLVPALQLMAVGSSVMVGAMNLDS